MRNPSDTLSSINGKLFNFSSVALGIKLFDISGLSASDLTITVKRGQELNGAVAVAVACLSLTSLVCLVRDYAQFRIAAVQPSVSRQDLEVQDLSIEALSGEGHLDAEPTDAERFGELYLLTSNLLLLATSIAPSIYGIIVFLICLPEVVQFFHFAIGSVFNVPK